nr:erythroblast NAD(P)(+)--arginine ADP-ribosyltransferase-like [Zonotrichia albicollis]
MATTTVNVIPLDMAPDSFDDQYQGCGPAMTAALPALNRSEFEQNEKFAQVWVKAAAEWQSRGTPESPLTPDQATAIMAFTMDGLRSAFNDAVRVAGRSSQEYRDNFHFKTLHFLLTQALLMLRDTRGPQCHIMYCNVEGVQFKAEPGDFVRFGQFMSASRMERIHWYSGNDTVFHVYTCHGTEIQLFSHYPGEVLIPPFETFKVVNVSNIGKGRKIQLRSNGTSSNYNCEWLQVSHTGPCGLSFMAPLAHTLALLAMTVATADIKVVPLHMAQNSFDDQYLNCGPAMTEALPALNGSELSGQCRTAWTAEIG